MGWTGLWWALIDRLYWAGVGLTTRTHAVLKIQVSFLEIETKVHLLRYKQLNTNVSSADILHYLSGCSSIPCIVNSLKSITSPIPREGSWQFLGCNIFSTMILRNKDNQAEQNINRKRLSDREIDSVRRKEKRVGSNGLQWASKLPGKAGETCHTLCWGIYQKHLRADHKSMNNKICLSKRYGEGFDDALQKQQDV